MNTQEQITALWLQNKGYTIRQAARIIGRSHVHVYYVLSGKRESKTITRLLRALPKRPFIINERLAVK